MLNKIEKLRQNRWLHYFIINLRFLIGATFIYAFAWKNRGTWDANDMAAMGPGDNPIWATFSSIIKIKYLWLAAMYIQLISGILLVTQRFALLGAVLFFPVAVCICLITWSVGFIGTKYIALLLVLATLLLLIWDYKKLLPIIFPEKDFTIIHTGNDTQHRFWKYMGIAIALVSILQIWYNNILLWLALNLLAGVTGFIFFVRNKRESLDDSVHIADGEKQ